MHTICSALQPWHTETGRAAVGGGWKKKMTCSVFIDALRKYLSHSTWKKSHRWNDGLWINPSFFVGGDVRVQTSFLRLCKKTPVFACGELMSHCVACWISTDPLSIFMYSLCSLCHSPSPPLVFSSRLSAWICSTCVNRLRLERLISARSPGVLLSEEEERAVIAVYRRRACGFYWLLRLLCVTDWMMRRIGVRFWPCCSESLLLSRSHKPVWLQLDNNLRSPLPDLLPPLALKAHSKG